MSAIGGILELNAEHQNALITFFLYALTCTDAQRRALFGLTLTDQEKKMRVFNQMNAVLAYVKDAPFFLDYVMLRVIASDHINRLMRDPFEEGRRHSRDSIVTMLFWDVMPEVPSHLMIGVQFDEEEVRKILASSISKHYNATIGSLLKDRN